MKVFLVGPMAGEPFFNKDAFENAELCLISQNCVVINPLMSPDRSLLDLSRYRSGDFVKDQPAAWTPQKAHDFVKKVLPWDVARMAECDAIGLMTGWKSDFRSVTLHGLALMMGLQIIELSHASVEPAGKDTDGPSEVPSRIA